MTEQRESWEHIAPELPPGWSVRNEGDETASGSWVQWWDVLTPAGRGVLCSADTREEAVRLSWLRFGITRRRYAEMIAVERVQEVAAARYGEGCAVTVKMYGTGQVGIEVLDGGLRCQVWPGERESLLDEAWACICAMGGGGHVK